jgi:hypothetical protein
LLFYPLRKRFRFMKPLGSIPNWFKLHMIFGILGPVLVLFHTTFRLGAMNDRIALTCMILVAGSGVFGRFFYSRIHHGLYGREASLREVEAQMVQRGDMQSAFAFAPDIEQRLAAFRERFAPGQSRDSGRRFGDFFMVGIRGFGLRWSLRGRLKQALRAERERGRLQTQQVKSVYSNGQGLIASHIRSVRDVSRFHIYQRLFSWWHILHIPLVYLLVFSAIFHVISVHMY